MVKKKKIGLIILVIVLFFTTLTTTVFSDDVKIIREKEGLIVEPSTKSFDLTTLKPGDTEKSKLTIINNGKDPLEVSIGLERVGKKQKIDLFEQLELTLNYGSEQIYIGKMSDLEDMSISLGNLDIDTIKELVATIHLPGPETGNEYQNKEVEFNWVFTAKSKDSGVLPKTGEDIPILIYTIGVLALGTGAFLLFKKKKVN
ncbi:LPXTG cell wall anchor domain-containing protein [Clostridium sp. D2Q-11]|uniref:LPXTG cell wall anchor domain-containing protein n=1 Tax=Anaeromonas frigoriresistens TaxID=2683708 RepID=A0A942Z5I5_9FIRM|nr:LPXTG cell wall anchor domain-containing protein [Anaeromonas frigoriresistens]MBS4537471.1 LPXTG cell wall anchor domain-containing protein [Anaeromonas frigoriresistens]